MNMNSRILALVLLSTFACQTEGKLIMKPKNTDVMINHSIYFNCSTDVGFTAIFWFHGKNYVYVGSAILEPYQERFSVDESVWNGTYIYNLVIRSVQSGDAGEYRCEEDEGFGEKYSVELVVFEDDPICQSNMNLDKVIGQNTCNIEPDEVELECRVKYHGNIPPQLEWRKVGENSSRPLAASVVTSGSNFVSNLMLKGDIILNNSSYVCEAIRTTTEPNKCTSKVINILYAQSDNSTVNGTIDDEIHCKANTSESCVYKWKWLQDNEFTIESSTSVLKAKKSGYHRCEAEYQMRNKTCNLLVMRVLIHGEYAESSQTRNIIIAVVVSVILSVGAVFLVIIVAAYCDQKTECCTKQRSKEEIGLLKKQREIYGLSVLHHELFISGKKCPDIEVYDSTTFDFKRRITVNGMTNSRNIASCAINNCLYASDSVYQGLDRAILRIDPIDGNLIKTWTVINGRIGLISVASDTNVILCLFGKVSLQEYTADGELIRTIKLDKLHGAAHAVKLNSGLFVVGCCGFKNRVCLIETKTTESNLERIDEVEILKEFHAEPLNSKNVMKGSEYVSVDKEGSILVSDTEYKRTVLLSSDLDNPRILIYKEHGLYTSWRSCYDESTNSWFVTDGYRVMVCWVEGETVEREICYLNSHHDDVTLS